MDRDTHILLIEDDAGDAFLIEEMLADQDDVYQLCTAESLAQARQYLAAGRFQLILMDLGLPDSQGLETVSTLVKQWKDIPIIVQTGLVDKEVGKRAVNLGAQDYLVKGQFDGNLLVRAINHAIERKHAQMIIETAAREWHTTFAAIEDMICLLDLNWKIVQCNTAAAKFVGASPDALIGQSCCQVFYGNPKPIEGCPFLKTVRTHRRATFTINKRGRYFQITTDPVFDADGRLSRIIHIEADITDRKHAEEKLQERQQFFQDIAESMGEWIWEIDAAGRFTFVAGKVETMLGYAEQEILGKTPFDFMTGHEAERVQRIAQDLIKNAAPIVNLENWYITSTGEHLCLITNGVPVMNQDGHLRGYRGVCKNITGRKRSEQIMASRLKLLNLSAQCTVDELLQYTVDEVEALTNSQIGFYHFFDEDQQALFLHVWSTNTLETICKADPQQVHYPLEQAGVWADCIRQRRAVIHNDYAALPHKRGLPDGHAPILRELMVPVFREEQIVAVLGVGNKATEYTDHDVQLVSQLADLAWDITERKRAEEALRHANEELERRVRERTRELETANRSLEQAKNDAETASRAKSAFLANMSHDLRTPLNAILGYSQLLGEAENLTARQIEGLKTITQSGNHLLTLINDILDLSKIEAGRVELLPDAFSLPGFLSDIAAMMHVRAQQQRLEFLREFDPDLPPGVLADEKRLRQVLINLLGNAIKFTKEGCVTLKVQRIHEFDELDESPGVNSPTQTLHFEIEDTGIGIPPDALDTIFDPFQQVNGNKYHMTVEGTGLGLAISRQLVDLMGGCLQVESVPDQGSRFWFALTLPIAEQPEQQVAPSVGGVTGYRGPRRSILVVDDQPANRNVLNDLLSSLGFEVLEAQHGREGLELAIQYQPDLIFLDLKMPVMDGFEASEAMRQHGITSPIVAISASVFPEIQRDALAAGCNDFLTKPFRMDRLLELLHTQLHLEWIFAEHPEETPEVDIPLTIEELVMLAAALPPDVAESLYALAVRGDRKRMLQRLEVINTQNAKLQPFVNALHTFAENFNLDAIVDIFEQVKGRKE